MTTAPGNTPPWIPRATTRSISPAAPIWASTTERVSAIMSSYLSWSVAGLKAHHSRRVKEIDASGSSAVWGDRRCAGVRPVGSRRPGGPGFFEPDRYADHPGAHAFSFGRRPGGKGDRYRGRGPRGVIHRLRLYRNGTRPASRQLPPVGEPRGRSHTGARHRTDFNRP